MKVKIKKHKIMGRGLFATKNIRKGEIIEISPVVVLDKISSNRVLKTLLGGYVFHWSGGRVAVGLGLGSLFNHSKEDSNVNWDTNEKKGTIVYKASRNIKKGEQLLINYNYDPTEWVWKKGVWREAK